MDLVIKTLNVEIIKKMICDGVPETQFKYDKLMNGIKKTQQETSATKDSTNAVKNFLQKTQEEPAQSATPRASISFAPSFPALDKAEITAMAKKALDEKGDSGESENTSAVDKFNSAEIETAEKTEKLVEKDQPKDVEASKPVDDASLRKTAENLCLKIITDVVDNFFAELTKKEGTI